MLILGNDQLIFALNVYLIHTILYWSVSFIFYLIDESRVINKYDKYPVYSKEIYKKVMGGVFSNQLLIIPVTLLSYPLFHFSSNDRPSFIEFISFMLVSLILEEIGFYYTHRLLHSNKLYWIHKKHHEFIYPIAMSALYCHYIEFLLSNLFPLVLGPLIYSHLFFPLNIYLFYFWIMIATLNTTLVHSGYNIFGKKYYDRHYLHHKYFSYNYGLLGLLDEIHNTKLDKLIDFSYHY